MAPDQQPALRFDILTLFPGVFEPFLDASILGIAGRKGLVQYHLHDIRDYSRDKHGKVDARPYGGGPGMVMRCGPVFRCVEAVRRMTRPPGRLILLTPQGQVFDQGMARELSRSRRVLLLCGRYEGFDERIREGLPVEEVSIGDYVLSGGEAAAMVIVDATVRLVPGVLGHEESALEDSFADVAGAGLEYPQYTRPAEFRGMRVPEVLLSGNHKEIEKWRRRMADERTRARRADLLREPDSTTETENG